MNGKKGRKSIFPRITAIVCSLVIISAVAFIIISGMEAQNVGAVSLPTPAPTPTLTPAPTPEATASAAPEEEYLSDEDISKLGAGLDDTGLSLMPDVFAFTEIKDPEQVVQEDRLTPGMHDERVIGIKERLMELNYMENDEPDDYFGEQTAYAIQLFQRTSGLEATGTADAATIQSLMSENASKYLMSVGINGTDVEEAQKRLKTLGYLKVKVTGYFGADTRKAVMAFQENNGLTVDGCIGEMTREVLYSSDAKKAAQPTKSPAKSPSASPQRTGDAEGDDSDKETDSTPAPSGEKQEDPTQAPAEQTTQAPQSNLPAPDSGRVETFISYANTLLGKPYVWGGKGPDKFDCSGFVYYALNQSGVKSIGYMTSGGWAGSSFPTVSQSELQRGDILCFNGHVGIYLGGGQMIDASSNEGKIRIASGIWSSPYWTKNFKHGKRVLY